MIHVKEGEKLGSLEEVGTTLTKQLTYLCEKAYDSWSTRDPKIRPLFDEWGVISRQGSDSALGFYPLHVVLEEHTRLVVNQLQEDPSKKIIEDNKQNREDLFRLVHQLPLVYAKGEDERRLIPSQFWASVKCMLFGVGGGALSFVVGADIAEHLDIIPQLTRESYIKIAEYGATAGAMLGVIGISTVPFHNARACLTALRERDQLEDRIKDQIKNLFVEDVNCFK